MRGPIRIHRRTARPVGPVIINDGVASDRQLRVQGDEGVHGGLIQVAIQPKDGQLGDGSGRQGVSEPSHKKPDLVVQQPILGEIRFDLLLRDG